MSATNQPLTLRNIDNKTLYDIIEFVCIKQNFPFRINNKTENWISWTTINKKRRNRVFAYFRFPSNACEIYLKIPKDLHNELSSRGIDLDNSNSEFVNVESKYIVHSSKDIDNAIFLIKLALDIEDSLVYQ